MAVMVMIYSVGNISGAHINPAVTLGFWAAQRLPFKQVPFYMASQFVGALAASFMLSLIVPESQTMGETLPSRGIAQSFVLEIILSFVLMFVILNVSTGHMEKGIMAGVAIGGTVALEALVGGTVSGASMNPARSLGPAVLAGNFSSLWIYLTAPFLGMLLASPTCRLIQSDECCVVSHKEE
jgi:aquaporin Z